MLVAAEHARQHRAQRGHLLRQLGEARAVVLDELVRGGTNASGGGRPAASRAHALRPALARHRRRGRLDHEVRARAVDVERVGREAAEHDRLVADLDDVERGQRRAGRVLERGLRDVRVEPLAAEGLDAARYARPDVELVVAEAHVVDRHRVERVAHRLAAVDARDHARAQEVAGQRADHAAALRGRGRAHSAQEAREVRVVLELVHVVHGDDAQHLADRRARPALQRLGAGSPRAAVAPLPVSGPALS